MMFAGTARNPQVLRADLPKKEWGIGVIVDRMARAYPLRSLPANLTVRDEVNHTALEITFDPVGKQAAVRIEKTGETAPCVEVYWFAWRTFHPETGLWQP